MEERDFHVLAQRIDKLEGQTRVLKRLLAISFVFVFAALAGGATIAQQKQLSFSSGDGSVKVNGSGISLYDTSGRRRLELGWNTANQPGVYFSDASGTTRMGLFLGSSSGAVVRLYNSSGTEIADYAEGSAGKPQISFFDASNRQRVYIGTSTADDPLIEVFDTAHTLRTYMGAYESGGYGVYVNDASGNTTWQSQ